MRKCKHTPKPDGMAIKWRVEMSRKGYAQHQCKTCGAWAVWKKEKGKEVLTDKGVLCGTTQ